MGIASSDKNTIRKMSEIEAVIYDRFLSIKCPDEKVNTVISLKKMHIYDVHIYGTDIKHIQYRETDNILLVTKDILL